MTEGLEKECLRMLLDNNDCEDWAVFIQKYADQETQGLKAELEDYKRLYATSVRFRIEDAACHNDEKYQDWERIKRLQSELSELKEKHNENIAEVLDWVKTNASINDVNGEWYYRGTISSLDLYKLYNETHKTPIR